MHPSNLLVIEYTFMKPVFTFVYNAINFIAQFIRLYILIFTGIY